MLVMHSLCWLYTSVLVFYGQFHIGLSTDYTFETDNDIYWRSLNQFTPIQGSWYGNLTRRNSMYCEFKMQYNGGFTPGQWEGVLRLGQYGNDSGCDEHGSRYPGVYILPDEKSLQISLSDTSDCWYVIESSYPLTEEIIYQFRLKYNQTHAVLLTETTNSITNNIINKEYIRARKRRPQGTLTALIGSMMNVIISDPKNVPADVILYDMIFITFDSDDAFPDIPFPLPTQTPTIIPTASPTSHTPSPSDAPNDHEYTASPTKESNDDNDDRTIQIVVAVDYVINNTNMSIVNDIIKNITEDIINEHIEEYTNGTGDPIIIIVVVSDTDQNEYDIILKANYTTNNETAIKLEVLFEGDLKKEVIEKLNLNHSTIIINEINVTVTINIWDDFDTTMHMFSSTEYIITETDSITIEYINTKDDNHNLLWYVIIGAGFLVVCACLIGFLIGYRMSNKKSKKNAMRQIRLESHENINNKQRNQRKLVNNHSDIAIGNVIEDHQANQQSNDDDDDDGFIDDDDDNDVVDDQLDQIIDGSPGGEYYINDNSSFARKKVMKDVLESVFTPNGNLINITPIKNHLQVSPINGMDVDESVEAEKLYNKNNHQSTSTLEGIGDIINGTDTINGIEQHQTDIKNNI